MIFVAVANLAWEFAHMPLYTLWQTGTASEIVLTASAASATVAEGVTLLGNYSAGLGVPFLLAAAFTDRLTRRLRSIGRVGRRLHQVAGLVMIAMGIARPLGRSRSA